MPRGLLKRHFETLKKMNPLQNLAQFAGSSALPEHDPFSTGPTEEQARVIDKMLEHLQSVEKQKNSALVLVCLPTTLHDYEQRGPTPAWRAWIRGRIRKAGHCVYRPSGGVS